MIGKSGPNKGFELSDFEALPYVDKMLVAVCVVLRQRRRFWTKHFVFSMVLALATVPYVASKGLSEEQLKALAWLPALLVAVPMTFIYLNWFKERMAYKAFLEGEAAHVVAVRARQTPLRDLPIAEFKRFLGLPPGGGE
ncbi:TPA: hypothetical protein ACGW3M_000981 [Pseudomonas aeruginosa]|uniref:hypothetical protein n=1 Tax=Pseudomonas aeruginosa TaxID=287 RepID=UPI0027EDE6AC|nr:hypothetical protein [Pseudomonas aeruginosa]ELJ2276201.1 hypothetical protein [Pseudomonas aeruginosa]